MRTIGERAAILRQRWEADPRWAGIERAYSAEDVVRLRGPVLEEHTLARLGATRLWDLLHGPDAIRALSDRQAARMGAAEPRAVYLAGGQPAMVRRVNKAMLRTESYGENTGPSGESMGSARGSTGPAGGSLLAPVVADAEAGSGGVRNAFELMTAMIEAGAAGVRFPGRVDGDAPVPAAQQVKTLNAARLAADVLDVPSLVIARTASTLRGLEFALYADLLWLEAPAPDLAEARAFARIIHSEYPGKILAYGCSPSGDRGAHLDDAGIATFRRELAAMGYRLQFVGEPPGQPAAAQGETGYFDLVTRALAPERDTAALAGSLDAADFVGHDQIDHHGRLVPGD
jgi:isocitrate lyase